MWGSTWGYLQCTPLGLAPSLANPSSPLHLGTWRGGRHHHKGSSHFSHAPYVLGTKHTAPSEYVIYPAQLPPPPRPP